MVLSRFKENPGPAVHGLNPRLRKESMVPSSGHRVRGILIFFLALGLTALFWSACTTPKKDRTPTTAETAPVSSSALKTAPPDLLSSLRVAGDSCYVFLRPDEKSRRFGPLMKGETLKWLDAQGSWIRVWIPRLRVSGWIPGALALEAPENHDSSESIPAHLMSTVTVIVRNANIREAPTTEADIILVAKRNQKFWLLKEKGGWYQIWLPDLKRKGWISGKIVARLRKE
jgi:uncharacterized protein YgiM (DUF1202 family)